MFEQNLEKNIDVFNLDKSKYSTVTFRKNIVNFHAIYRAINVYMSNKRQATAKTKNRSEVRGGGKKPWKQKGTGRARTGSIRSPLWVGGGIVFGPRGNQNFKLRQNRKEYFLAFCSSLTLKINNFIVLNYDFKNINKTKNINEILKTFGVDSELNKILIIVEKLEDISKSTRLSVKNFNKVKLVDVNCINVYDIINAKYLVFTLKAFEFVNKLINNRINHK